MDTNAVSRTYQRAQMSFLRLAIVIAAATAPTLFEQALAAPTTRVVILGVDHSAQLVSPDDQAGLLTAFLERVHPDAVCIERPPDLAAQRDFYEFTYEVQGIVLPYTSRHPIEVCPIDWMPSLQDQMLAFGSNLDVPPEIRPTSGFSGFLTFPERESLKTDFFAADDPATTADVVKHMLGYPGRADQDFPRRLYLYRTFMQAQLIRSAAHSHPGGTVLVVVGYFHKPDLEANLSHDPLITLVRASSLGRPSPAEVERATTRAQRLAVLAFNLLGRQAATGNVDLTWVEDTWTKVAAERATAETNLLRVRLDEMSGRLTPAEAIPYYRSLVEATPEADRFSWTGVKDAARIDSYFDPFGNLTVKQRAEVELARCLKAIGATTEAANLLREIAGALSPRKSRQLADYAEAILEIDARSTAPKMTVHQSRGRLEPPTLRSQGG